MLLGAQPPTQELDNGLKALVGREAEFLLRELWSGADGLEVNRH